MTVRLPSTVKLRKLMNASPTRSNRSMELEDPVHVIWGVKDSWIPVDRADRLAELMPNTSVTLIEDAGHLIQLDAPAALTAQLMSWVSGRA